MSIILFLLSLPFFVNEASSLPALADHAAPDAPFLKPFPIKRLRSGEPVPTHFPEKLEATPLRGTYLPGDSPQVQINPSPIAPSKNVDDFSDASDDISQGLSSVASEETRPVPLSFDFEEEEEDTSAFLRAPARQRPISESPSAQMLHKVLRGVSLSEDKLKEVRDEFYYFLLDIEARKESIDLGKAELLSPEEMRDLFLSYMKTFKTIDVEGTNVLYNEKLISKWTPTKKGDHSPIGKDQKPMHLHHLSRTDDSMLALLPASLHVHKAYHLFKKKRASKKTKIVETKLETEEEDVFFNMLHPQFDLYMERPSNRVKRDSKWNKFRQNALREIYSDLYPTPRFLTADH